MSYFMKHTETYKNISIERGKPKQVHTFGMAINFKMFSDGSQRRIIKASLGIFIA